MGIELPFNTSEIRRAFGEDAFLRGQSYAEGGRVSQLEVQRDGEVLLARVKGRAKAPYRVHVTIAHERRKRIISYCSCPVGMDCKHGAAVMLAALGDRGASEPRAPASPPRPAKPAGRLSGPVDRWLAELVAATGEAPATADVPERALYILNSERRGALIHTSLAPKVARRLKSGGWGAVRDASPQNLANGQARYVRPEDVLIGRLLNTPYNFGNGLPQEPETLDLLFERVLATGRCLWESKDGPVLRAGPEQPGRLAWSLGPDGSQRPMLEADDPALIALQIPSPWYVDPAEGLLGRLAIDLPRAALPLLLRTPPIEAAEAGKVRRFLEARSNQVRVPPPSDQIAEEVRKDPPRPVLTLTTARGAWRWDDALDLAYLHFDYDGVVVEALDQREELRRIEGQRVIVQRRHQKAERAAFRRLGKFGLARVGSIHQAGRPSNRATLAMTSGGDADWWRFVHRGIGELEAEGWQIIVEASFRHRVLDGSGDWQAALGEKAGWWFSLDLGVEVAGERLALLPVLAMAIRQLRAEGLTGSLEEQLQGEDLYARLEDGRVVALPVDRVRPMLATLLELYDAKAEVSDGRLDVSFGQALALAGAETTDLRWQGGERLQALAVALRGLSRLAPAEPPAGFGTHLRPYQAQGLAWLGFLSEHDLGGILADDMGLGKTIQTLAHILSLKQAGRLEAPCLVVCPTSLVANWRLEAERHAPALRVLSLHGREREADFAAIGEADLVITTYALLTRDAEVLLPVAWQAVVLDEAQAIKNPASKASQTACRLQAGQRLCLTGTPIENNLSELFSEVNFLMPGLLGDRQRFTRLFRTPIEKAGDPDRQAALVARIRPFVLRRTKAEVEAQLPEKSEIVQRVALAGPQRDLYETVRLAMHERVRNAIQDQGFAKSQIVVLDALLKLRQVCCDPRLLKLAAAKKAANASAKLHHLVEILPQLVAEWRRILLFSQFTSMLDLIVPEMGKAEIPFVELRGDTADRKTPVECFQRGEVPLFLLSLKAGGVGLNLTAADTVILYDPWWNPAVEAQAADRAHRIGQDKPVFVYKLIAEGTIEERLLELQSRKRALAEGLLAGTGGDFSAFDETDLERLLAPLG